MQSSKGDYLLSEAISAHCNCLSERIEFQFQIPNYNRVYTGEYLKECYMKWIREVGLAICYRLGDFSWVGPLSVVDVLIVDGVARLPRLTAETQQANPLTVFYNFCYEVLQDGITLGTRHFMECLRRLICLGVDASSLLGLELSPETDVKTVILQEILPDPYSTVLDKQMNFMRMLLNHFSLHPSNDNLRIMESSYIYLVTWENSDDADDDLTKWRGDYIDYCQNREYDIEASIKDNAVLRELYWFGKHKHQQKPSPSQQPTLPHSVRLPHYYPNQLPSSQSFVPYYYPNQLPSGQSQLPYYDQSFVPYYYPNQLPYNNPSQQSFGVPIHSYGASRSFNPRYVQPSAPQRPPAPQCPPQQPPAQQRPPRRPYPDSCIGVLQFILNVKKHANEHRRKRNESPWSEQEKEALVEIHFPGEMLNWLTFLWEKGLLERIVLDKNGRKAGD